MSTHPYGIVHDLTSAQRQHGINLYATLKGASVQEVETAIELYKKQLLSDDPISIFTFLDARFTTLIELGGTLKRTLEQSHEMMLTPADLRAARLADHIKQTLNQECETTKQASIKLYDDAKHIVTRIVEDHHKTLHEAGSNLVQMTDMSLIQVAFDVAFHAHIGALKSAVEAIIHPRQ